MDLGTAKKKAINLINEKSSKGVLITDLKNADYLYRMNELADMAQKEIATIKKIHAVYSISQNPIANQMGDAFDLIQHLATDLTDTVAVGSRAYYFEVDKPCTVYVEEETSDGVWTVLSTITGADASFTAHKGLINPSLTTNNVRLRFSGSYPYNIRNRALFAYTFATTADVPDYCPYVKYTMPATFMELNKVVQQTDSQRYKYLQDYHWEGKLTFAIRYLLTGSFDVLYFKYPADITTESLDTVVFEVETDAQELIPLFIAGHILLNDNINRNAGILLLNEYQGKLANLSSNKTPSSSTVQNDMGW